ncbi:MAG: DNA methyltransferase, partial [Clostridia bacterium]
PIESAFTIVDPDTGREYTNTWAFSKESLARMIVEKRILWKENLPKQKEFLYEMTNENKAIKSSWGVFDAQSTTVFLKHLIPEVKFENPKPLDLMKYLIGVSAGTNDIVIDFFSGSATTAHAVMKLNAEDGGHRKFIMVQLPEVCPPDGEAAKAGYPNICEIGKERIRRAGRKIKDEAGMTAQDLDIGFRVLRIDSSNMQEVYYTPQAMAQSLLDPLTDNIKPDRTPEDLLFQVMLELGVLLSSKIEETVIAGKRVFRVADGFLLACFEPGVTAETITAIAKQKPYYAVLRDSGMDSDSVATNFEQIFQTYSPDTVRKVL